MADGRFGNIVSLFSLFSFLDLLFHFGSIIPCYLAFPLSFGLDLGARI
jgi:hypothetical protein